LSFPRAFEWDSAYPSSLRKKASHLIDCGLIQFLEFNRLV
jgi:hypothetical protein